MLNALFVLGLVLAPPPPPTDVATLSWMSGRWAGSQDGMESEEVWTSAKGGSLLGIHRDIQGGRTVSYEFFRIEVVPEEFPAVRRNRARIAEALLRLGFSRVTLDLGGYRRGSLLGGGAPALELLAERSR